MIVFILPLQTMTSVTVNGYSVGGDNVHKIDVIKRGNSSMPRFLCCLCLLFSHRWWWERKRVLSSDSNHMLKTCYFTSLFLLLLLFYSRLNLHRNRRNIRFTTYNICSILHCPSQAIMERFGLNYILMKIRRA